MLITKSCLALAIFFLAPGPALPAAAQEVHFSPEERLDAIDAALIDGAKRSIDFASYPLTDSAVLNALSAAERRGVVTGSCSIRVSITTSSC